MSWILPEDIRSGDLVFTEITLKNTAHRKRFLHQIILRIFTELPAEAIMQSWMCGDGAAIRRTGDICDRSNGSGIPVYRKLQRQGIPFITGVLHTNDADYQVARELAGKVIVRETF